MKEYKKPTIEFEIVELEDIVATSFTLADLFNLGESSTTDSQDL